VTESDFLSLPAPVALRLLFDALDEGTRAAVLAQPKPKLLLPPKYDQVIYRSGGVQWASETDLEGLRFWHGKALEDIEKGGEWLEKNKKRADTLARWIAWREQFPDTTWSGERDKDHGVARGPSAKPKVYPKKGGSRKPAAAPADDINPDADVPY
jgi:hypothetical protein